MVLVIVLVVVLVLVPVLVVPLLLLLLLLLLLVVFLLLLLLLRILPRLLFTGYATAADPLLSERISSVLKASWSCPGDILKTSGALLAVSIEPCDPFLMFLWSPARP